MNSKAVLTAVALTCLAAGARASERRPSEAAYLQLVFTKTAEDCANRKKAWDGAHPAARKRIAGECFLNATLPTESSSLPGYFLQLTSTTAPLSQPAGADMTLTYKSLGPMQLAPVPPGSTS